MPHEFALHDSTATLRTVRRMLLGILFLSLSGTAVELFLLGHYDGIWQWPPLVLIGLNLVAIAWHGLASLGTQKGARRVSVHALRLTMLLLIGGGVVGVWLHFDSNVEFELEIYPSMTGRELVWESLTGAIPALAPGSLIPIGLIGLCTTYRHPAVSGRSE